MDYLNPIQLHALRRVRAMSDVSAQLDELLIDLEWLHLSQVDEMWPDDIEGSRFRDPENAFDSIKAGAKAIRQRAIDLAWAFRRFQPDDAAGQGFDPIPELENPSIVDCMAEVEACLAVGHRGWEELSKCVVHLEVLTRDLRRCVGADLARGGYEHTSFWRKSDLRKLRQSIRLVLSDLMESRGIAHSLQALADRDKDEVDRLLEMPKPPATDQWSAEALDALLGVQTGEINPLPLPSLAAILDGPRASQNKAIVRSAPRFLTNRYVKRPDLLDRDKWLHGCWELDGLTWPEMMTAHYHVSVIEKWEYIETEKGIREAIEAYCEALGNPPMSRRPGGRKKKRH